MGSPDPLSGRPTGLKVSRQDGRHQKEDAEHKFDIDALYAKNAEYEEDIRQSNSISDQFDIQIRDTGKKVQKFETAFEEILEKMTASAAKMDEAEKEFKDKDDDVNAAARRVVLMEGEATVSVEKLATTVMKLALMSKEADNIIKGARHWESKNMNNEMEIETLETNLKEAKRIASDNEMKSDNLARSLAMMEDELKRAEERVVKIEEELSAIGENQKQLEISEEKARRREEKYQDQIKQLNIRLKESDSRSEYAEMNITKLHLRIDELEDEIIREKLKINAVSGQLDDTFNEMLNKY